MAQEIVKHSEPGVEDAKKAPLASGNGGPETAEPARGKEAEVDEVMQFLQFSVKPDTTFAGTILFKFKGPDGKPDSSYAVQISDKRGTAGSRVAQT